jgi:ABC-type dipeptide/oligopeptide/nickel transport system permease component
MTVLLGNLLIVLLLTIPVNVAIARAGGGIDRALALLELARDSLGSIWLAVVLVSTFSRQGELMGRTHPIHHSFVDPSSCQRQ